MDCLYSFVRLFALEIVFDASTSHVCTMIDLRYLFSTLDVFGACHQESSDCVPPLSVSRLRIYQ